MVTQIELVLRNQTSTFSLLLEPRAHSLAKRWVKLLERDLEEKTPVEKEFCFLGFLQTQRNRQFLQNELKRLSVELKTGFVFEQEDLNQEVLNQLHHHFESFIGQSWDLNPKYLQKSALERKKIGELNHLIHELEAYLHSEESFQKYQKYWPVLLCHFLPNDPNGARENLQGEDYDFFDYSLKFGEVRLQYSQLGKPALDAWRDGDEFIGAENISGLQQFSSGFEIQLGPDSHLPTHEEKINIPFRKWLEAQGAQTNEKNWYRDHKGQKQGFGHLIVADCPRAQFASLSVAEIQSTISKHNDLDKIRLHSNTGIKDYQL